MSKSVQLGTNQYLIIALAVITAVIHIFIGGPLFILNGLGYLGLVGLYYFGSRFLPQVMGFRPQIRWVLIGYTAITIILYFVMNPNAFSSPLGLITKAVEIILIVMLLRE